MLRRLLIPGLARHVEPPDPALLRAVADIRSLPQAETASLLEGLVGPPPGRDGAPATAYRLAWRLDRLRGRGRLTLGELVPGVAPRTASASIAGTADLEAGGSASVSVTGEAVLTPSTRSGASPDIAVAGAKDGEEPSTEAPASIAAEACLFQGGAGGLFSLEPVQEGGDLCWITLVLAVSRLVGTRETPTGIEADARHGHFRLRRGIPADGRWHRFALGGRGERRSPWRQSLDNWARDPLPLAISLRLDRIAEA